MPYAAGELDERVTIQRATETPDGMGGFAVTWAPVATVWAHVRPRSGRERAAFDRIEASGSYLCVIRRRTDIGPADRILWRGRVFNIRAALPVKSRQPFMELDIELGVAT